MEIIIMEWVGLVLRWAHVIVAMVWVGTSFYLLTWENKFNRSKDLPNGIAGNFWTIQGGDFYYVEKTKNAPERLPEPLHWFKYEAYFTWLSGFALLCVLYYAQAPVMLVAPGYPIQSAWLAVVISAGSLAATFGVYSLYSATRLARNLQASALLGLVYVAILAGIYTYLFPVRTGILHLGAALGTIMSANVYFYIIPWHKRLVRAIDQNEPTARIYQGHPGYRSRHNHYLTLPCLFLMLGSHAPGIFDGPLTWLIVTLVVLAVGLMKHWHTCIQRNKPSLSFLFCGLGVFVVAAVISATSTEPSPECDKNISYATVRYIVQNRCSSCHQFEQGSQPGTPVVKLNKPSDLLVHSLRISERVVVEKSMPPGNATGMLEHERQDLACWLKQNGAVNF